jgi:hypothetical protein
MHYRTEAINFMEPADEFLSAMEGPCERLRGSDFDPDEVIARYEDGPVVVMPAAPRAG